MKCIEVVREEDCEAVGLLRKKGFDILNLDVDSFKPGFINILKKSNSKTCYVKKPHKYIVGSMLSDVEILRFEKVDER